MESLVCFSVLTLLTTGITEVIKKAVKPPKGVIPLIALIVGFFLTMIADFSTFSSLSILTGIAIGLSASGLFDLTKYPIRAVRK